MSKESDEERLIEALEQAELDEDWRKHESLCRELSEVQHR
jgi:hypothetical protein